MTNKEPNKEDKFKKLTTAEQRLQFLYREIFYLADKIEQVFTHQNEMGQLLINLIKEFEKLNKKNKI